MFDILDEEFAPLRISTQNVDPKDIIKDAKNNHEQMSKIRKIPLVIKKCPHSTAETPNIEVLPSGSDNHSTSFTHEQDFPPNELFYTKCDNIYTLITSIEEQYLMKNIQSELRTKLYSFEDMWCNKQNQLDIVLPAHYFPAYSKIYNALLNLIELDYPIHNNENCILNLIDTYSTNIHAGEIVTYCSIQNLRKLYSDHFFIIVKVNDQPNTLCQQVLYQVISQIEDIDPNLIEALESGAPYSNFIKLLINLIEYSSFKSRIRSFLIFIDKFGCLKDIYNKCLKYIDFWNPTIRIGYVKLCNKELNGFLNIICDSYPSNENEYFHEIKDNLIIKQCDNNEFVDIFNTTIVNEIGKQGNGLANLLTDIIRSHFKAHTSSLNCYQLILETLIINEKNPPQLCTSEATDIHH